MSGTFADLEFLPMPRRTSSSTVGKPTLVQPTGPATRQRLVESARYLFWERGFAGASMADILAHAKVNSGSFYHFFDSKEALLCEVLESYLAALQPMIIEPAFAQTTGPSSASLPSSKVTASAFS